MKDRSRKKPKRSPGRPKIDDDLATLMLALDTNHSELSLDGWLSLPWHDGWNAAALALSYYNQIAQVSERDLMMRIYYTLAGWTRDRLLKPERYEHAGELMATAVIMVYQHNMQSGRMLAAAARCVELTISNSHGGGHTFNSVLRRAFEACAGANHIHVRLNEIVREHRCWDAIGTTCAHQGDANDRLRHAFEIAWDRGLYKAAYALPRVK